MTVNGSAASQVPAGSTTGAHTPLADAALARAYRHTRYNLRSRGRPSEKSSPAGSSARVAGCTTTTAAAPAIRGQPPLVEQELHQAAIKLMEHEYFWEDSGHHSLPAVVV